MAGGTEPTVGDMGGGVTEPAVVTATTEAGVDTVEGCVTEPAVAVVGGGGTVVTDKAVGEVLTGPNPELDRLHLLVAARKYALGQATGKLNKYIQDTT